MSIAIKVENLNKVYSNGTQALKDVSMEIMEGDFFALLGANGAGKTTMIGILTGLVNKTSGKAKIFDFDIDINHEAAKNMIGVVPQEFNFNIFEKVQDIIITQAGYYGIERKFAVHQSEKLLKQLGLWEKRDHSARSLSGGMKRRLMIARALVHSPQLLVLDEPTAGVDVELRYGMWEYLKELNKEGTTVLLTTHYLEEVEQMCQHAAIIKNGYVVHNDSVRNLVKMLEKETFDVTVQEQRPIEGITGFEMEYIDEHTLEVELRKDQTLNDFIHQLTEKGIVVTDIRPQGHRLEKLFLSLLNE